MVPVPLGVRAWHEAQIDELFSSLLGRGFKTAEEKHETMVDDGLRGFRIFG